MKQTEKTAVMLFYESFEEAINGLMEEGNNAAALALYRAIVRYGLYGEIPDLSGTAAILWKLILPNLANGRNKALAGKKGGKASKTNNPDGRRGKLSNLFTLENIRGYIDVNYLNVNAEEFYNYYSSRNWEANGKPIKSLEPLLRRWSENATAKTWEGQSTTIFNKL